MIHGIPGHNRKSIPTSMPRRSCSRCGRLAVDNIHIISIGRGVTRRLCHGCAVVEGYADDQEQSDADI